MNTLISETAGTTSKRSMQSSCRRCAGQMEYEMCIDLESDSGRSTFWCLRCIQCGDIVDEVILRNRSLFNPEATLVAAA